MKNALGMFSNNAPWLNARRFKYRIDNKPDPVACSIFLPHAYVWYVCARHDLSLPGAWCHVARHYVVLFFIFIWVKSN